MAPTIGGRTTKHSLKNPEKTNQYEKHQGEGIRAMSSAVKGRQVSEKEKCDNELSHNQQTDSNS